MTRTTDMGGLCIKEHIVKATNKRIEISRDIQYLVLTLYASSFVIFGCLLDTPSNIIKGLVRIIKSTDILITDYMIIGGMAASFVNSGIITLICIFLLYYLKVNMSGMSIASLFLLSGFALFGKNIFNIWLIILGVFLYTKVQKERFAKYVNIALLGTGMSPIITEILFVMNYPIVVRITLSVVIGISIGFVLPPLSSHMMKFHQGFNLYNIGFTTGIIVTILVSLFKSYGYVARDTLIWSIGNNLILGEFLSLIFLAFIITGFYLNGLSLDGVSNIFGYSGRLICDFVLMEGFPSTLINMGLNGFLGMGYILLAGGSLNGPTVGGILTIMGFGGFGKHWKNITPTLFGVFMGSIIKLWSIHDPKILIAALFGTSLAPISGHFGWQYGVIAGFINASVVLNISALSGGINLYNTGFAAGVVAAMLVPIIEAFQKG